jgi:hypothetical protein
VEVTKLEIGARERLKDQLGQLDERAKAHAMKLMMGVVKGMSNGEVPHADLNKDPSPTLSICVPGR